jgi:hypothetical protein
MYLVPIHFHHVVTLFPTAKSLHYESLRNPVAHGIRLTAMLPLILVDQRSSA